MALLQQGARFAARKMPKVINPTAHAALDYAVAASFLLMGARLWRRHRRAAVASLMCGGAAATNALLTDYPGGVFRVIDYKTHGRIDAGIAAMTASAPQLMGFSREAEARFFSVEALAETVVTGMTDYNHYSEFPEEHPLKAVS